MRTPANIRREYIKKDSRIVAALLSNMGFKNEERVQVKIEFLRMLMRLQLNEADQRLIYGFFETYLKLTEEEEEQYMKAGREFDEGLDIFNLPIYHGGERQGKRSERRYDRRS